MIDQLSADLVALADRLRQSTVQIRGERAGVGSGVIWRPDGLIVTNAHVLSKRETVVDLWDGRTLPAKVVRRDASRDLAALQVSASELPAAAVGDADRLRVGEWLFAMGNPLGTVGALTIGILCATADRRWLQADIRLAPGNSGGLLANAKCEVVGINSMIVNGLGFAIPSGIVQRFLRFNRPTLGVTLQPVWLRRRLGFLVLEVAIDSVAAGIPLLVGDVITELDGRSLTTPYSLSDILDSRPLDKPLQITVLRGDRTLTCEVLLPNDAAQEAA